MKALPDPCLMLVTEPMPGLPEIVREAVRGGVNVVQYRDKRCPAEAYDTPYARLQEVVRPGVPVLFNSDLSRIGAGPVDGLHLSENGIPIGDARRICPSQKLLVGRSVHSVESAVQAEREGADYVVAGSIFSTPSHPGQSPRGLPFLEKVCHAVRIPVIAIGGVDPERAAACLRAGAAGVAVLSAILKAADPAAAAAAFWDALCQAPNREE